MHSSRPQARFVKLSAAADRVSTTLEQAERSGLRRVLTSQAMIHMAEGALIVLGPMPTEDARRALADTARALNAHVHVVAEHVLNLVQGAAVPDSVFDELHRVLTRYRRDVPNDRSG
ncbi:antitermination regulator [Streptomyces longwoodensis]|uniref:antitermination regulator n=1 Tax=Streptomyces longwoodensis TaxID=68231 RepID=UPI0036FBF4A5